MSKKRETWVDILRGFSIFLVVLGHAYSTGTTFFFVTNPIKIPMIYLLAGYVAKNDVSFPEKLKKTALRLLPPWLIFSLLPWYSAKYLAAGDLVGLQRYLIEFFTGKREWFILSFFLSQLLFYFLDRVTKQNRVAKLAGGLACFLLAVLAMQRMTLFCFNTAVSGVFYMALGSLLRSGKGRSILTGKPLIPAVFGAVYVATLLLSALFYPGARMDFHIVYYYNIPLCLLSAVSGSLLLVSLTGKVQNSKLLMPMAVLGKHTIVVYLLNNVGIHAVSTVLGKAAPRESLLACVVIAAAVCVGGTLISMICEKYVPWSVGLKKKK